MKTINGITFHDETPNILCNVIIALFHSGERIRVFLGDNGKAWTEEYDVMGYIGRSNGINKVPLLIPNKTSLGGGALLDHCIAKIIRTSDNRVLYQHENFRLPEYTQNGNQVFDNGILYANCKSEEKAKRLVLFLKGERFSK